jgi:hypothetical protein
MLEREKDKHIYLYLILKQGLFLPCFFVRPDMWDPPVSYQVSHIILVGPTYLSDTWSREPPRELQPFSLHPQSARNTHRQARRYISATPSWSAGEVGLKSCQALHQRSCGNRPGTASWAASSMQPNYLNSLLSNVAQEPSARAPHLCPGIEHPEAGSSAAWSYLNKKNPLHVAM